MNVVEPTNLNISPINQSTSDNLNSEVLPDVESLNTDNTMNVDEKGAAAGNVIPDIKPTEPISDDNEKKDNVWNS